MFLDGIYVFDKKAILPEEASCITYDGE